MAQRTCERPDCDRPHRARGLCGSHYNQEHAPDRHKKKLVECVVCGTKVERQPGGGRRLGATCSSSCRRKVQSMFWGESSKLPADHWARWYGKASAWPRYGISDCGWCGEAFVKRASNQVNCSLSCTWRRNAGVIMTATERASQARHCARCGGEYMHAAANRVHCSDLCRELDRKDRGVALFHGWISGAERATIYARDAYTCMLCGEPVDMQADPQRGDWYPTLDHIVPRSKGGAHDADNLRTAHRWCNSVRGDRDDVELFELTA